MLSQQVKQNIETLANWVENNLLDNQVRMSVFVKDCSPFMLSNDSECGTVACLLGWCTVIPEFQKQLKEVKKQTLNYLHGSPSFVDCLNSVSDTLFESESNNIYTQCFIDYLPNNINWLVKNLRHFAECNEGLDPTVKDYINTTEEEALCLIKNLEEERNYHF